MLSAISRSKKRENADIVARDAELEVGTPTRLFERPFDLDPGGHLPNYDVATDGRFLMLQRAERPGQVRVVMGWVPEHARE